MNLNIIEREVFKTKIKYIKKIITYTLYAILTIFYANSCNTTTNKKKETDSQSLDTFYQDISSSPKGKFPFYYTQKVLIEPKLDLASIERGFDSLQIRLWYGYAFNDTAQLIMIKYKDKICNILQYDFVYGRKGDSSFIVKKSIVEKSPISDCSNFINELLSYNILTLPDYSSIKNSIQATEASGVVIEIATSSYYRIYYYPEPSYFRKYFEQSKKISQILEYISYQLNFHQIQKI